MAASFPDVLTLMRLVVQTSTTTHAALGGKTLNAVLSGRVVGARLLDADAQTLSMPSLVVDLFGGASEYSLALQSVSVYLYAYSGDSEGEALALYEAARDVLQGVRLYDPSGNVTSTGYARETSRPIGGANQVMKTWFARGAWRITSA